MGYMVLTHVFKDGHEAGLPLEPVLNTIRRHVPVEEHEGTLSVNNSELAEHMSIFKNDHGEFTGMAISRPITDPDKFFTPRTGAHSSLSQFLFELVTRHDMVFFTQDGDAVWAGRDLRHHLPDQMADARFIIVSSASQMWPNEERPHTTALMGPSALPATN